MNLRQPWGPWIFLSIGAACAPAGGEALPDASLRFPDARVDAGRVRNRTDAGRRDAGAGILATDDAEPAEAGELVEPSEQHVWYSDIEPMIRDRCGLCHAETPVFGAPRSLVRYEDEVASNAFGQPVHELVAYRVVASSGQMPPPGQPRLTQEQVQAILDWSEQGAPMGSAPTDSGVVEETSDGGPPSPSDGGIPLPWADGGSSGSAGAGQRWVNLFAHAPNDFSSPYIAQRNGNGTSYYCFGFTVPENVNPNAPPESAVFFEPFIDNYRHVHHIFVYFDETGMAPDGPNYINTNFGRIFGSWFPGRGTTTMPEGTGVPVVAGQRLNLELHYDSVPGQGAPDMSGMRVLLTEQQELITAGETWAGVTWNGALTAAGDLTMQSIVTNQFDNVTVFSATHHMHGRGISQYLEYRYANDPPGSWRLLSAADPWDFNNQVLNWIEPPLVFNNGDQLRTTCVFSTASGPITFGLSSDNEMCFVFMYHYRNPLLPFQYFVGPPL